MFCRELRYAVRALTTQKSFTVAALLTVAFGIGATTAIFAVVNGVLLRPLPYREPDRIVLLWSHWTGWNKTWLSEPELADYRERAGSLEHVAGFGFDEVNVIGAAAGPLRLRIVRAQAEMFQALGIVPIAGRTFGPDEDRPGGPRVAVLSGRLWRSAFGGDVSVVGRRIQLDGNSYDVIGVLGEDVRVPTDYGSRLTADLWVPLALGTPDPNDRGNHGLFAAARLRPGATLAGAQAQMDGIAHRFVEEWPRLYPPDFGVTLTPVASEVFGGIRPALLVLLAAGAALLLIACANVTNLMLARTEARSKELAIRAALGAGSWSVVRPLFAESLLLSIGGAVAGAGLADIAVRLFTRIDPARIPRGSEVSLDGSVLVATAATAIACTLLIGLAPAWKWTRGSLRPALNAAGRTDRSSRARVQRVLLVTQMASSVPLAALALLLTQSFVRLLAVDPGFNAAHVLTLRTSLPETVYRNGSSVVAASDEIRRRLAQVPGSTSVGGAAGLPLASVRGDTGLRIEKFPNLRGSADWQVVTPGYFEALGTPLRFGRLLTDADTASAPSVALVNESVVRQYFGGRNPVGERLAVGLNRGWSTIVGVVADARHRGLDAPPRPEVYRPHAQFRFGGNDGPALPSLTWVIRTDGDPLAMAESARSAIRRVDPGLGVSDVATMSEVVADSLSDRRMDTMLSTLFGALAVALTSIGVYGVVAYSIAQRRREIGIRLAVGARAVDVWLMLVAGIAKLAAAGIGIGLAVAFAAATLVRSLVFQASPTGPAVLAAAAGLVATVSLGAAALAGRRASRITAGSVLSE